MAYDSGYPFTVDHYIDNAADFDGAVPDPLETPSVDTAYHLVYPADSANRGLISLGIQYPIKVLSINANLGGQTTWTLEVLDENDVAYTLDAGTTESGWTEMSNQNLLLLPGYKLKLTTTGGITTNGLFRVTLLKPAEGWAPSNSTVTKDYVDGVAGGTTLSPLISAQDENTGTFTLSFTSSSGALTVGPYAWVSDSNADPTVTSTSAGFVTNYLKGR